MKWIGVLVAGLLFFAAVNQASAQPVTVSPSGDGARVSGGQSVSPRGDAFVSYGAKGATAINVTESDAAFIAAAVAPGVSLRGERKPGGGWTLYPTTPGAGKMDIVPSVESFSVYFSGHLWRASPQAGGCWSISKIR